MARSNRILGISKTSLWNSWKAVRAQLKRAPRRDILDYLEFDIDPNVWIKRLLDSIRDGSYSPQRPTRYSLAKSNGFDRIITIPQIPDLVLYRTIIDHLYFRSKRKQAKHVYFRQTTLSELVRSVAKEAKTYINDQQERGDSSSKYGTQATFLEWLKYDQYRKLLIFDQIFPFIVITDIANFFDSVLYGRIEESLHDLAAPAKMVSLLFTLLEEFSIREPFTPVQRIGLPVDPADCSRTLAHMALLPHDERIVDLVGENSYVRWMDDQNVGVSSRADGLAVLGAIGDSLRRLHLTPNTSKSKILSLKEAKVHFHFNSNRELDRIEKLPSDTISARTNLRRDLKTLWFQATTSEGKGEWQKVLKRIYRQAARADTRLLRRRAVNDVKTSPALVDRISDYMRYTATFSQYMEFVETLLMDPEQVYGDVNYQLVESLLKLEPNTVEKKRVRQLAQNIMKKPSSFVGQEECKVLVPHLYLRFGDRRNIKALSGNLGRKFESISPALTRSICSALVGFGGEDLVLVRDCASRLLRNHLSEFVKMIDRIENFTDVPGRFKNRIAISRDSITGKKFVDMRTFFVVRLLGICSDQNVKNWIAVKRENLLQEDLSDFDKRLIRRLWPS